VPGNFIFSLSFMTQMMTLKVYEVWAKKLAKLVKFEIFDFT